MRFIILDTETTGLPKRGVKQQGVEPILDVQEYAKVTQQLGVPMTRNGIIAWMSGALYVNPEPTKDDYSRVRMWQLAFTIYDTVTDAISNHCYYNDYKTPDTPYDHTTPYPIPDCTGTIRGQGLATLMIAILPGQTVLCAHNMNFDYNVLLQELSHLRGYWGDEDWILAQHLIATTPKYCTMLHWSAVYKTRWIRLAELYTKITGGTVTQTHLADADVDMLLTILIGYSCREELVWWCKPMMLGYLP